MLERICFITVTRGNHFMTELLEAVAATVEREGVPASIASDAYPPHREGTVYVVIPHEFFELATDGGRATERQLQRTIGLCVENPGTQWFERTCKHAARLGMLMDIRRSTIDDLRWRGLAAEHFPLGYAPEWDHWGGDEDVERPLDVVFLGADDERRRRLLASYGDTLWGRRIRLLIPPEAPKSGPQPNYVSGAQKHELLRSSSTMINIHHEGGSGFEWVRALESIANGCVLVSEHSIDYEPLEPGRHFISAAAANLALLANHLLDDPERLKSMRQSAYELIREELPMEPAAQRMIAIAEGLVRRRVRYSAELRPLEDPPPLAPLPTGPPPDPVRAALKRLAVDTSALRRDLAALRDAGRPPVKVAAFTSDAYAAATPRVSIGVAVYDDEAVVEQALASAAASEYHDYEIVVVDDGSSDNSAEVVRRFAAERDHIPLMLVQHGENRGPGPARNTILEQARGELVFILDSDNALFPTGLGLLVDALDGDEKALLAFGILVIHEAHGPVDLVSYQHWDPSRFHRENWIDAMALVRREPILELGGFSPDRELAGYEDYDLWCRIAEAGGYGVQVPQFVGRYQSSQHSLLSLTNIDTSRARSMLRSRSPRVWGGTADRKRLVDALDEAALISSF